MAIKNVQITGKPEALAALGVLPLGFGTRGGKLNLSMYSHGLFHYVNIYVKGGSQEKYLTAGHSKTTGVGRGMGVFRTPAWPKTGIYLWEHTGHLSYGSAPPSGLFANLLAPCNKTNDAF